MDELTIMTVANPNRITAARAFAAVQDAWVPVDEVFSVEAEDVTP